MQRGRCGVWQHRSNRCAGWSGDGGLPDNTVWPGAANHQPFTASTAGPARHCDLALLAVAHGVLSRCRCSRTASTLGSRLMKVVPEASQDCVCSKRTGNWKQVTKVGQPIEQHHKHNPTPRAPKGPCQGRRRRAAGTSEAPTHMPAEGTNTRAVRGVRLRRHVGRHRAVKASVCRRPKLRSAVLGISVHPP